MMSNWQKTAAGVLPGGVVNVKDFGAKGDGITDDAAAIQAAMNVGRIVCFPEGVYLIATSLKLRSNQILTGNATIMKDNIDALRVFELDQNVNDILIQDLILDGNNTTNGTTYEAIDLDGYTVKNLTIDNVIFKNFSGSQVIGGADTDTTNTVIQNCYFTNNGAGVSDHSTIRISENGLTVDKCYFEGDSHLATMGTAIEVHTGNVKIVNSTVKSYYNGVILAVTISTDPSLASGIHIVHNDFIDINKGVIFYTFSGKIIDGTTIEDNYFELINNDSIGGAIYTATNDESVDNLKFLNNIVKDKGTAHRGVYLTYIFNDAEIAGNTFEDIAGFSILASQSGNIYVHDNVIKNYYTSSTTKTAIYLTGVDSSHIFDVVVKNNTLLLDSVPAGGSGIVLKYVNADVINNKIVNAYAEFTITSSTVLLQHITTDTSAPTIAVQDGSTWAINGGSIYIRKSGSWTAL